MTSRFTQVMQEATGENGAFGPVVHTVGAPASAPFLIVCEHASNRIPDALNGLGLAPGLHDSHIAWDPGAIGVAKGLADLLAAPLVHGGVSRLVYDCNRPPDAPDAIPALSEIHAIPGNEALTPEARQARISGVYEPFRAALQAQIKGRRAALSAMVTVHSFTPVYKGRPRAVEVGMLHGQDPRLACAVLSEKPPGFPYDTQLNEPYGPKDGVVHTLDAAGTANDLLCVMIEIRSDLIASPDAERAMAEALAPWLKRAVAGLKGEAAA